MYIPAAAFVLPEGDGDRYGREKQSFDPPPPLDNVNGAWDYQGVGNKADGKEHT